MTRDQFLDEMKIFEIPSYSHSYEETIGEPEKLSDAIGRISMNFSALENLIANEIIKLIKVEKDVGDVMTAELSFKNKINAFASLYKLNKTKIKFNACAGFEEEHFKILINALNRCEELRNHVIHSHFTEQSEENIVRTKITAKQKYGLKIVNEETNIMKLISIADSIIAVAYALEEFCLYD